MIELHPEGPKQHGKHCYVCMQSPTTPFAPVITHGRAAEISSKDALPLDLLGQTDVMNYEDRVDLLPPSIVLGEQIIDTVSAIPAHHVVDARRRATEQAPPIDAAPDAAITELVEAETGPGTGAPSEARITGLSAARDGWRTARQLVPSESQLPAHTLIDVVNRMYVYSLASTLSTPIGPAVDGQPRDTNAALFEFADYCFWHGFGIALADAAVGSK